jgi:hypothetical protein
LQLKALNSPTFGQSPTPNKLPIYQKLIVYRMPALGAEAVILFERYEQKDKSLADG